MLRRVRNCRRYYYIITCIVYVMHQPLTQSICATATLLLMSMPLTDNTWRGAAIRMCLLTQWASREVTEENLSVWKAGHQECRLTSPLSNDPALQLWSAATSQYTACYHSTQYLRYRQYIIHWNMTQYAHSSRSTVNWQWHSTSSTWYWYSTKQYILFNMPRKFAECSSKTEMKILLAICK